MDKGHRKHLQSVMNNNFSCYVLITCGKPTQEGEMEVEMTYEGDPALAAYLLQGARVVMEQKEGLPETNTSED